MAVQLLSNVKIITSGVTPTTANLLPGQAAFGKVEDGKYHLFGNIGEGGGAGKVVDIVLDSYTAADAKSLEEVLTAGNTTKLDIVFQDEDGTTKVTVGPNGFVAGTTKVTETGFVDNGKVVLSANPSLVVPDEDATTMRGFLKVYSKAEIDAKVASTFHFKGSVEAFANLPEENNQVGDVYNVKTAGGTDVHGNAVKAGDNVVWVDADTSVKPNTPAGWDVLAGVVDLSNYYNKSEVDSKVQGVTDRVTAIEGAGYQTAGQVNTAIDNKLTEGHYVSDESYVHTDNNYTAADKDKVDVLNFDGEGNKVLLDNGTFDTLEITVASI